MAEKHCQNCKRSIGVLEESYKFYSQIICKDCMMRLEKQFGEPGTINRNIETELPNTEELIEQSKDMKSQITEADEQAITDPQKDTEHFKDKSLSGNADQKSTNKVMKIAWLVAVVICLAIILTTIYILLKGIKQ